MTDVTGWGFWRFCFRLGLVESVRGLDYFRFYEYPTFYASLDLRSGQKVLDLGCGRGLFPLFCASHHPDIEYTAVDIDETAVEWQKRMASRLGGLPNFHPLAVLKTRGLRTIQKALRCAVSTAGVRSDELRWLRDGVELLRIFRTSVAR